MYLIGTLKAKNLWLDLIIVIMVVALFPKVSLGGPRAYDISIFLGNEHPVPKIPLLNRQPIQQSQSLKPHAREESVAEKSAPNLQPPPLRPPAKTRKRDSLMIFGGRLTTIEWDDLFAGSGDFEGETFNIGLNKTYIAGIASSWEIYNFSDVLSFEIEGQVVRHFKAQQHWEINFPIVTRWSLFPWNNYINTSFAFGVGGSYVSKLPKEVLKKLGNSERWLLYVVVELALGLPGSDWSTVFRIHHRSGAFGLVADDAGSNVFVIGLRRRF